MSGARSLTDNQHMGITVKPVGLALFILTCWLCENTPEIEILKKFGWHLV